MNKQEIVNSLRKFGLSEYESKAYAALVFLGPSKASIISRDSQVPQPKIYGVLEQLMHKQLVEFLGGRPSEFRAIEPNSALKNLLEEKNREIETLKKEVSILNNFLKPIKHQEEVLNGVWTTEGRKWTEFQDRVAEMFARCEKYAYVVSRDFSRSSKLAEAVKNCKRKGVKIRTISMDEINENSFYRAKWYNRNGVEIKVFKTKIHPRIILMDGKEVLIRLDQNPTKTEGFKFTSLWSADPAMVKVFDSYLKNLWKMAKPVDFDRIEAQVKKSEKVIENEYEKAE